MLLKEKQKPNKQANKQQQPQNKGREEDGQKEEKQHFSVAGNKNVISWNVTCVLKHFNSFIEL